MEAVRHAALPWEDESSRPWALPDEDLARPSTAVEPERPRQLRRRTERVATPARQHLLLRLLLVISAAAILVVGVISLVDWARVRLDDVRYGRPRTTHLTAFVGHFDGDGVPTHLMAMNLNRRITIVEIPGGDPSRIRTIAGPYLVGRDEDLTMATMRLLDVNGDSHPDLLLRVKQEELVYINDRGEFRLMTRAERPQVERLLGGAQ